jgi:hypothetical protein
MQQYGEGTAYLAPDPLGCDGITHAVLLCRHPFRRDGIDASHGVIISFFL